MWRALLYILVVAGAAMAMARFAEVPGNVRLDWHGYEIETSAYVAAMALLALIVGILALWSMLRFLVSRPAAIARRRAERRHDRGLEALRRGMIALSAGDTGTAEKQAALARRALPDDPLIHLLEAQNAEARSDREGAQRIYAELASDEPTRLLGLRGLLQQALQTGDFRAARQYAERAVAADPRVAWGVEALFDLDCRHGNWEGALATLAIARQRGHVDRPAAERRRAVILTGKAQDLAAREPDAALEAALDAHKLAPDLVPAAALAGSLLAGRGQSSRAQRLITRTWRLTPHPDLARAHTEAGGTARERLDRAIALAALTPDHIEAAMAIANAAIEAREWEAAREALEPHLEGRPSARICTTMARIESGGSGNTGKAREWLARAVRAPRDPVWMADGQIAERWAPVSPVTGKLDAFVWRVPYDALPGRDEPLLIESPDDPDTRPLIAQDNSAPDKGTGVPVASAAAPPEVPAEEPAIYTAPRAPDDPGPDAPSPGKPSESAGKHKPR